MGRSKSRKQGSPELSRGQLLPNRRVLCGHFTCYEHRTYYVLPLGGHSLRAGCATQAAMNGVNERDIMRQTSHKSPVMLAKYIRIGQMFTHNAAAGLGI